MTEKRAETATPHLREAPEQQQQVEHEDAIGDVGEMLSIRPFLTGGRGWATQLKLKELIIASFVPREESEKVKQAAIWDDEHECWVLERLRKEEPAGKSSKAKRPVSASGLKRPMSDYAKIASAMGDQVGGSVRAAFPRQGWDSLGAVETCSPGFVGAVVEVELHEGSQLPGGCKTTSPVGGTRSVKRELGGRLVVAVETNAPLSTLSLALSLWWRLSEPAVQVGEHPQLGARHAGAHHVRL